MGAKKETKDKPDLSLIPYCVEAELAKAMEYGAAKYQRYNYTKGHNISQLVAAAKRHLGKYLAGEESDDESGVHHLGHVMANCLMMLHQRELGTLKDDRFVSIGETKSGLGYREFKVGDKVYTDSFGEGVVSSICLDNEYPIYVNFSEYNYDFTVDGYFIDANSNHTLNLRHL